jgi:DNA-binding response OmpR family regulator
MEELVDCQIVRCPGGTLAHPLIKSEIGYSLFVLDEELGDTTGRQLALFARSVRHRERTPIIILSRSKAGRAGAGVFFEKPDDLKLVASVIDSQLTRRHERGPRRP